MGKTIVCIMFIIFSLYIANSYAVTIYKWTDENGVVHFSDRPATRKNTEVVEKEKKSIPVSDPSPMHAIASGDIVSMEMRRLNELEQSKINKIEKINKKPPCSKCLDLRPTYRKHIESIRKKKELLKQNPDYYFYKYGNLRGQQPAKGQQPERSLVGSDGTAYAPTGNGNYINTSTGEVLHGNGSGGAVGTRDGTFYAPNGAGGLINTRTGQPLN